MRTIKFRAWDKTNKKMIAVPSLHFGDDGSALTTTMWVKKPDGYNHLLVFGENAELMQFTCCKDIDGDDIYEGDILKVTTFYDAYHAQVVWDRPENLYTWMNGETWMLHFTDGQKGPLYPYTQPRSGHDVKILGNIYETPELLQALKDEKD